MLNKAEIDYTRLKWLWLALLAIVLDFATKQMAQNLLLAGQNVYVLPIFNLTLAYNTGSAFGFLAAESGWQRWLFAFIAIGVSTGLCYWMVTLKKSERLLAIALALVIGGALGNLYDRLAYGKVVDFLHFHWGELYNFPIFNIADCAITLGAILLILDSFKSGKSHEDK